MFKYTMIDEKMELTDRMKAVMADIKPRLRCQDARESTDIEPISNGGRNPFADVFEAEPESSYVIKLAKSIAKSWVDQPCVIYPHEAVVGIVRPCYPMMEHFSWGIVFDNGVLKNGTYPEGERERCDKLRDVMTPLSAAHVGACASVTYSRELHIRASEEGMFMAGGFQGHTIPNYVTLLENGLDGMLEKIDFWAKYNVKDKDSADFYEANRIIVRGMSDHMQKYADYAADCYETETDPVQKQYYKQISENCAYVAHKKPQTLYQAVQLAWCLSLWDWVDCLGRMDQYFLPFYNYSCEHGDVIPVEDSIASMIYKIWENGAHNVTLSGCKPEDGTDATNDLSFLILQVLRNIHDTHPRICVRIREDVKPELMDLIVKIWSEGMSDPSIISDTLVIPGLQRIDVPIQDARDFATLGCQEVEIPGKSNTGCEDGLFNLAKVLEVAMKGGKSTKDGKQLGPVTKTFLECETFEELYESFTKQIEFFTELHTWLCSRGQECRAANHAKLVKGVFTDGVLESGKNHDDGGPIYGYGVIETAGVAVTADSLTAIKKLVFDEKKITKEQLVKMLEADFEGYEKERQLLLNGAPKFGNDDPEADEMAVRVLNTYWDEIAKYKSVRGGVYTGACSLLTNGIIYGKYMGAMPDGRHKGEPLGNTIGPRPGADHNGVTAMLNSVSKLPLYKGVGGTTLNVTFTTKMLSTPEQRDNISAVIRNFMASGGQMAQITTANLEDLIDAKAHPERHGDLIVRVGGYSIQFVQLSSSAQNEIISRYVAG